MLHLRVTAIDTMRNRVNIGSARLYGLEEDLGLVGNQYQLVRMPDCALRVASRRLLTAVVS